MRILSLLFLPICHLIFTSCQEEEKKDSKSFERKEMLENYADNYVMPSYSSVIEEAKHLQTFWNQYKEAKTEAKLKLVFTQWEKTVKKHIEASLYDFGPGARNGIFLSLQFQAGQFPVDTIRINKILAGTKTVDLDLEDSKGLFALDYLFFKEPISKTNTKLQTSAKAIELIDAITKDIIDKYQIALDKWKNNYRQTFVEALDLTSDGSTYKIMNAFAYNLTILKNNKLAYPTGIESKYKVARPNYAEAYYAKKSTALLDVHLKILKKFYTGNMTNQNGMGYQENIEFVGKKDLSSKINLAWKKIETNYQNLSQEKTLEQMTKENNKPLKEFVVAVNEIVPLLTKQGLTSIGIGVAFSDNDGD